MLGCLNNTFAHVLVFNLFSNMHIFKVQATCKHGALIHSFLWFIQTEPQMGPHREQFHKNSKWNTIKTFLRGKDRHTPETIEE